MSSHHQQTTSLEPGVRPWLGKSLSQSSRGFFFGWRLGTRGSPIFLWIQVESGINLGSMKGTVLGVVVSLFFGALCAGLGPMVFPGRLRLRGTWGKTLRVSEDGFGWQALQFTKISTSCCNMHVVSRDSKLFDDNFAGQLLIKAHSIRASTRMEQIAFLARRRARNVKLEGHRAEASAFGKRCAGSLDSWTPVRLLGRGLLDSWTSGLLTSQGAGRGRVNYRVVLRFWSSTMQLMRFLLDSGEPYSDHHSPQGCSTTS